MAQKARPFSDGERADLARLWPTKIPDKQLAHQFGRHRGVLYREAARLGLLPRRALRASACEVSA